MLLVHLHREAEIQEYAEKEKKKKGKRRWFASDGFTTSQCFTTFCYLEDLHLEEDLLKENHILWICKEEPWSSPGKWEEVSS
ncbi:hypothetical protein MUG91_G156n6 [Manis pentadactyla]|nr:hypothetical protein MUG91_G156n6 [Manis pentadactyla]